MDKDNVILFQTQDYFEDPLTEVIWDGRGSCWPVDWRLR